MVLKKHNNRQTPWRLFYAKLKKNRLAMISAYILLLFYLCAIFAGFIAPYSYEREHRAINYAPPTKIHFYDHEGNFYSAMSLGFSQSSVLSISFG